MLAKFDTRQDLFKPVFANAGTRIYEGTAVMRWLASGMPECDGIRAALRALVAVSGLKGKQPTANAADGANSHCPPHDKQVATTRSPDLGRRRTEHHTAAHAVASREISATASRDSHPGHVLASR